MPERLFRTLPAGLLSVCALAALLPAPARAAETPDPAWSAYGTYYDTANGLTGPALLTRLRSIVSSMTSVSYDNARVSQRITDRIYGGAAGANMWGVYDRASLTPSNTSQWNREHVWPESKLGSASTHDLFGLRPALTATNGGRGNNSFGGAYATGAPRLLPINPGASSAQFFAGDIDKGDVARSAFYMATRYSNLNLVTTKDGLTSTSPANTNMGDRDALLHWHYQDMPDNFERRRNQYIYINPENTGVDQGNRNPFVDHPEYVWSVWGDGANDSQITVNTGGVNGASTRAVNFGRVIVGGAAPSLSTSVTVSKSGADPTTFSVATTGAAVTDGVNNASTVRKNIYNGFDYGAGSRAIPVTLTATTATAGLKSGGVTIDNTDITTQTAGTGNADGDDTIDLSLAVLDHANASFAGTSDVDAITLNFGAANPGQTVAKGFSLYNLLTASGYTAGLDLDSITATGDTAMFGSGLGVFSAMAAGSIANYAATFTPTTQGVFSATYVLGVSDENLAGATAGTSLKLTLTGVTSAFNVPEPTFLALAPMLALALRRCRAA